MPEIKDIFLNDLNYGLNTYINEWINISIAKSLTYSVYCSENCDVVIEYAFDNQYQITETITKNLVGGSNVSIPVNVEKRFARLSVLNIAKCYRCNWYTRFTRYSRYSR
jgi:hypothetical protein